ncbi:MAG: protoporphyrinogen oxidase [Planctomycetota bacterium]|nr:MAG: protoporphyrinogen oxidase [Planctomycetota bacterium]
MSTVDVAIVGGGYAGLAVAHFARRRGLRPLVLERDERPGGKVLSRREAGAVVELGPLGFLDKEPAITEMAADLGLRPVAAAPAEKVRYLLHRGRITALPSGPWSFLTTPFLSPAARLRVLAEPFVPARRDGGDESARDFARRRLGRGLADAIFEPFVSGVYAGDPARLSAPAAFPLLAGWERDHGSLTVGAIRHLRDRARRRKAGEPVGSGRLCTFPGGLLELAEAGARSLGDAFRPGCAAAAARRDGGAWVVLDRAGAELARAPELVVACPAPAAAELLAAESPALAAAVAGVRGDPLCVVAALFRREQVREDVDRGFGFLAARSEGFRPLGVQFAHAIFPDQTPAGLVQLRVLIGGAFDPEAHALDDAGLYEACYGPLRGLLGLAGEPLRTWTRRVMGGVPQYELGHLERMATVAAEADRLGGLHFAGDSFGGVGVVKAFARARAVAAALRGGGGS